MFPSRSKQASCGWTNFPGGQALGSFRVYGPKINEPLLLRALTYFEDAEREAPLPGEGGRDWETVKEYFQDVVAHLLLPPPKPLAIQAQRVDVQDEA
jgi:hypothetical protein